MTVPAGDCRALEALARYCLRNPVSLACRGVMMVVSFITEGRDVRRILDHLGSSARLSTQDRAPPPAAAAAPVSL